MISEVLPLGAGLVFGLGLLRRKRARRDGAEAVVSLRCCRQISHRPLAREKTLLPTRTHTDTEHV